MVYWPLTLAIVSVDLSHMRKFLLALALGLPLLAGGAPLKVMVDAGHGGKDRGAQVGSVREADITLAVSKRLVQRLETDKRFQGLLTRPDNEFLSLSQRVRRAQKAGAELFISIHVNSSTDRGARGMEVYFQNQLPSDEESMFLAARENREEAADQNEAPSAKAVSERLSPEVQLIVQDLLRNNRIEESSRLAKSLKLTWKGRVKGLSNSIRQAPFFVISNLEIPSALVEMGYLTHPQEGSDLVNPAYQDLIAQSLHAGISLYYEGMDKSPGPRLQ